MIVHVDNGINYGVGIVIVLVAAILAFLTYKLCKKRAPNQTVNVSVN